MAPTIQANDIALAVRDSSADQVKSQWQGPGNIMDILLLVGADVVQAALAQVSGSNLPTPVTFSFGWLTYSFSALVSAFGDSRLLPSPDVSCFVIVELMSTEVCGIADGNQMRIKLCVVFLLI